jgi:hypothetical protein
MDPLYFDKRYLPDLYSSFDPSFQLDTLIADIGIRNLRLFTHGCVP